MAHIVVGHTVQRGGRIRGRFGDKVFLIDTGMLSSYYPGGRASALEICGDVKFGAKYMDGQTVLLDSAVPSPGKAASGADIAVERLRMRPKFLEAPQLSPAGGIICPAAAAAQ